MNASVLDWYDDVPASIRAELKSRYEELTQLQREQTQLGTSVPQLYGSLSRFIANPSTVSVETYKRMLDTDETLGSGIDFMNLAMISRFGDYTHPNEEVQAFVRKALNAMEGSWHECLDEMLSAEWAGFSVTEKVWEYKTDFSGMPAFVPKRLVTYPPLTLVFAVNSHGDLLTDGIFQYQRYHNTFSHFSVSRSRPSDLDGFRPDLYASVGDYPYPIRIGADLSYLTVRIPRHKVVHLRSSATGTFRNPYGRSILRRAYKNWVLKDAFLKMWVVAADRKGTPLLVGYAAPNDTVIEKQSSDGGMESRERADRALASIMKTVHNSSFVVLPGRKGETYEVEAIQVQGDMNVFKDGITYFNQALMRSLLLPPLVMSAGDGAGSYALGQEHHKIFAKIIDGKLKVYKQGILDQFIKPLIAYNFPKSAWERDGMGEFVLEEFDPEIMEKLGNVFRTLVDTGFLTASQQTDMDYVRQKMGLPKALAQAHPTYDPMNQAEDEEEEKLPPEFQP